MGFLDRIRGRARSRQALTASDEPREGALKAWEGLLRQHLSRLTKSFASDKNFRVTKPIWDRLLLGDVLAFTTRAIDQEMRNALADHRHHYQARRFGDLYVAASAIPVVSPSQARAYFDSGYLASMDVLLKEGGLGAGDTHLAHWITCYDGEETAVHLTFVPATKVQRNGILVLAQDLMTAEEKARAGIG